MSDAPSIHQTVQKIIERARREHSTTLDLSSYEVIAPLEQIPNEVFDLLLLETLILCGNNIREVPERIRDLVHLKQLSIISIKAQA